MLIFSTLCNAQEFGANSFEEGKDYQRLAQSQVDDATDLTQLQQIADIEIFYWYGCESCLKVEKALQTYLEDHPEVSVLRTPLVAFPDWRAQAYLQPILEQLEGKVQIPSTEEIYQQCIEDCSVFSTFESSIEWLKSRYQIANLPTLDETSIWRAEKNYRERADSFSISQVPTIIIRESYVTDANSAQTTDHLVNIVDHLLKGQVD